MKNLRLLSLLLAFAFPALTTLGADKTPTLAIDQALKIAQDYLDQHGAASDHQIISLSLQAATIHSVYWYAHWQPAIVDGQKKDLGLRINMDGSTAVMETGPSGGYDPPVGQRPQGARNMR